MSKSRKRVPPAPPAARGDLLPTTAAFDLKYTVDAATEIKGLDGSVKKILRKVLEKKLAANPEGYGLPLRGPLAGYWKHEFANHRVIYRIYPDPPTVVVCAVGPRKQGDAEDVYAQLQAVAKTGRLAEQLASVIDKLLSKKK